MPCNNNGSCFVSLTRHRRAGSRKEKSSKKGKEKKNDRTTTPRLLLSRSGPTFVPSPVPTVFPPQRKASITTNHTKQANTVKTTHTAKPGAGHRNKKATVKAAPRQVPKATEPKTRKRPTTAQPNRQQHRKHQHAARTDSSFTAHKDTSYTQQRIRPQVRKNRAAARLDYDHYHHL